MGEPSEISKFISTAEVKSRLRYNPAGGARAFLRQVAKVNQQIIQQHDQLSTELIYCESLAQVAEENAQKLKERISKLEDSLKDGQKNKTKQVQLCEDRLRKKMGSEFMEKLHNLQTLSNELCYFECLRNIHRLGDAILLGLNTRDYSIVLSNYRNLIQICTSLTNSHCHNLTNYLKSTVQSWHSFVQNIVTKSLPEHLTKIGWPFDVEQQIDMKSADLNILFNLVSLQHVTRPESDSDCSRLLNILFAPFKKRFVYHFYGEKPTNLPEKPDWFYTQILKWIETNKKVLDRFVWPAVENFRGGIEWKLVKNLGELAKAKVEDCHRNVLDDNSLFSHLIDETVVFQMELGALGYGGVVSCVDVLTSDECLHRWIHMERVCNVEKTDHLLSQNIAWSPRYQHATDLDTFKVPQCTDDFLLLLQLITERYRLIESPVAKCGFVDLQKQLLDDFRVRLLQKSRSAKSAWDTPLPQILNSASYVAYVISEWSELPFFIQLQGERMKIKGDDKIEGAFEAISELFVMLQQQLCKIMLDSMINGEFRPALAPYAAEQWFCMSIDECPSQITASFCPLLLQLRERFTFLKEVLSESNFNCVFRRGVKCVVDLMSELIIDDNSFNCAGGTQLLYDVTTALVPLIQSFNVSGSNVPVLLEKCSVVGLPVGSASLMLDTLNRRSVQEVESLREFGIFHLDKRTVNQLLKQRVDVVRTAAN